MSKLKLTETPKRTLEIERPDGEIIVLTLRKVTRRESESIIAQEKMLQKSMALGEISPNEGYDRALKLITEDYNPDDFQDIEISHMAMIADELKALVTDKEPGEKKSQ